MSDDAPSKAEEEGYYDIPVRYDSVASLSEQERKERLEEYERRQEWSSNGEVYYGRRAETYAVPDSVVSDTTEPQDEPLEKQFIDAGWTSDGEHEHPVAPPPKELLALPDGTDDAVIHGVHRDEEGTAKRIMQLFGRLGRWRK